MRPFVVLAVALLVVPAGWGLAQSVQTQGNQSPAVNAPGGHVAITYQTMSAEEKAAFAKQVADTLLEGMKTSGVLPASPNAKQSVTEAVTNIAQSASQGDPRLQQALNLLAAGNAAQATPLLQAVADEKSARITQDRKDAATAYRNLGAIAGLRDPTQALLAYAKAAEYDPDDVESLYWAGYLEIDHGELSSAETRLKRIFALTADQDWRHFASQALLGDIAIQRGNPSVALQSYHDSLAIADRLAKADPSNALWQLNLSALFEKVGNVQLAQGDLPAALQSYRDSLAIFEPLVNADPGNAGWQRDLSIAVEKVGNVQRAQGNLAAAQESYHHSLAIAERLANADPGNANWQRDLSVVFERLGDVQVAQGNLPAALQNYQQEFAIQKKLVDSDPTNLGWQRTISVTFAKVGDVQQAQGNLPEALQNYQQEFAIQKKLVDIDPTNLGWQRDLEVSYGKVAIVFAGKGAHADALKQLQQAREIAHRLTALSSDNATWRSDLEWVETQIAEQQRF